MSVKTLNLNATNFTYELNTNKYVQECITLPGVLHS